MEMHFFPATLLLLLYSRFPASFVVPSAEVWGSGVTQVSPGQDAVTQPAEIHGLPPTALLFLLQAFPGLLTKPAAEC